MGPFVLALFIKVLVLWIYFIQKVTAQVKENQKKGESITKLTVKATGRSQFPSLKDRDVVSCPPLCDNASSSTDVFLSNNLK